MTIKIRGELEIDQDRGVIYFHAGNIKAANTYGPTPLRICRVPKRLLKTLPTDITIKASLALSAAAEYGMDDVPHG